MKRVILKLENLTFRYAKHLPSIINGITCEFERGRLYAITGSSGSGKTTLISMIAALAKPTSGRILYDGRDTAQIDEDTYRSKCVSIIFQSYNLLYNYTAIDNIRMALHVSGHDGNSVARAEELLEEVGIPKEKRRYVVQNLSGGEQQRIAIARALATDSGVILADEPTGNLDDENKDNIMRIFRRLADEYGKCVIIVTHSSEIAESADRVLRIADGTLV